MKIGPSILEISKRKIWTQEPNLFIFFSMGKIGFNWNTSLEWINSGVGFYELRTRKDDFFDLWETNDNERFGVSAILTRESISQDHDSSSRQRAVSNFKEHTKLCLLFTYECVAA